MQFLRQIYDHDQDHYYNSVLSLNTIGGLTAVIWTDFVQTIIMVIGAVLLCILSKFLELFKKCEPANNWFYT